MSIALAVTLAALSTVQPSCSWDRPGVNPYTGNANAAIDRYTDLPPSVRAELKKRIASKQPDDMVSITRDAITSDTNGAYDPAIRDMHFGAASVCHSVTRNKWAKSRVEPAAVYCADTHCILVPKICGNISRITRPAAPVAHNTEEGGGGRAPILVAAAAPVVVVPAEAPPMVQSPREVQFTPPVPIVTPPSFVNSAPPFEVQVGLPPTPPTPPVPPPVPEPDTWAMLLAGVGLLGWLAKRRAA
ncbi:MHFG family PEP-CTERM protein [Duganella sp. LX20W]|uniref:MHFG family PEP-CTERM protein n=1 Tax=Rugamonas brunnea TaxID=2758569 RepID=A0A7W2EU52_9BURK|nr:MHFG family PEP-CTERM protein [Rugamonas brunnea]MBA5638662.1 MHFG family PEP-CTERM protein [Rugamonas brunnea]